MPGQVPQDRPDFAARIFVMKSIAMMSYVIEEKLFGNFVAYLRELELPRRRLSQTHYIFYLY